MIALKILTRFNPYFSGDGNLRLQHLNGPNRKTSSLPRLWHLRYVIPVVHRRLQPRNLPKPTHEPQAIWLDTTAVPCCVHLFIRAGLGPGALRHHP